MRVRGYAEATPCWVTLSSTDPAFYAGLFGWEYDDGVFRLGDRVVAGLAPELPQPGWLPYMSTEDITETTASVVIAGGTVLQPPSQTAPGGLAALYADPAGAVFGCWQRGGFAGSQVVNEPGALLWSEVAVRDQEVAEAFYGKVFGWHARPGDHVEWTVAGRVVAGMSLLADGPTHWRVHFEIDDADETVWRCLEWGGRVVTGPLDIGVGRYAHLSDPGGASFGVLQLIPSLRDRL